jgi:toluene monooxygenase system ferredoxin subunit
MSWEKLLAVEELWLGELRGCVVAGRRVLLLRVESGIYAYEDRCAHLGLPLSDGCLRDGVLTCSAHGFQYDARTGAGINPKRAQITPLPVRVEDGHIWVEPSAAKGRLA